MSRDYRGRRIVVYPSYFDSNRSRREGRRVPLSQSIPNPRIEEIVKTCERLGLNPEVEPNKTYPRDILSPSRIIVDKKESKLKTLILIASELKKQYKKK
ncbi:MAG: signal recognition particle subunit SRP19/SEC65 family protein [Thermosphaera sp.]|nr:signal recognition particle subunit SRP19/SEC65 family protein [Thermosphaera sp.]